MFAHGLRQAHEPLSADFSTNDVCFTSLIGEGWMIASTSYRRNGYIIGEAIEDLDQLRQHIVDTYGAPKRVFLEGGSMGGAIVTRMAETREGRYAGALAVGPVLSIGANPYDFTPKMPLLMLSNQNEFSDPPAYAAKVTQAPVKPARWIVKRDGHCNVTSAERLAALRAIFGWSEGGAIELERDGTIAEPPPPSAAVFTDGAATAKILYCASQGGSVDTEFTAADLAKLGIAPGAQFQATCKGKTVTVRYGTRYSDVPQDDWVAFIRAEGQRLRLARNYANAVEVLGCAAGDAVTIAPAQDVATPPRANP
jgi:hypothetical protein